jgi:thiamine pyrophosphate-dependent acetolactate synthase large subunit-like protein
MKQSIIQIAGDMQVTRQYVDQTLKRAMRKVYKGFKRLNPDSSPFEIVIIISKAFKISQTKDFEKFFTDFPEDVRKEVMEDALTRTKLSDKSLSLQDVLNHNVRTTKH